MRTPSLCSVLPSSFPGLMLALVAATAPVSSSAEELTGVRAPAQNPSLSAPEARQRFKVPEGFEIRLFAAEPMVTSPVAMTWDERGRLWVVELYEYPLGAPEGATPRDRIRILEDTDGDEVADRVTTFADGLNLATGILVGYGGVFVGQAPHFLFLEDTDGDDRADRKTLLKTGFGLHDTHELLNGFTWGPDGWLYMTHGVFTHSEVIDPSRPAGSDDAVRLNAAVARYHPRTRAFEIFADGTSNPWGVDFDGDGNAFVSACVIDHMFHMAPGGHFARQGGSPENPFGYELLPSIVDHNHFRAAFAGIQVYQGHQFPEEYRGTVFLGNIHGNSVHQDRLERNGSTFVSSFVQDFVTTDDGWFRPVSVQTGPDGALWIMDWHDKYPCYQNAQANPEGVDRSHGRIWRVVHTGGDAGLRVPCRHEGGDMKAWSTDRLVEALGHPNNWQRRTARRLLAERVDPAAAEPLRALLNGDGEPVARYEALLALHDTGMLGEADLDRAAADDQENLRTWAARLTGERRSGTDESLQRLRVLAGDASSQVRLAVATALRQHVSGALTVTRPVPDKLLGFDPLLFVDPLLRASAGEDDRFIAFLAWMTLEPSIAERATPVLEWIGQDGRHALPHSAVIARKTMMRLCDTGNDKRIDFAARFLRDLVKDGQAELARACVAGLVEGQRGRAVPPTEIPDGLFAALNEAFAEDPETLGQIGNLAALWGDASAVAGTLAVAANPDTPVDQRIEALKTARRFQSPDARDRVLALLADGSVPEPVRIEALRTLGEIGDDATGTRLVETWNQLPPRLRGEAAGILIQKPAWTNALVGALEERSISPSEIPVPVVRSLLDSPTEMFRERARAVVGAFRPSSDEVAQIIAAKYAMLAAEDPPLNLEEGRILAQGMCLTCHKLHGEGQEVGPDLTGVGRSNLTALLTNIVDPNQIIGSGYELVNVSTKDGRTLSGRMTENSDVRVVLRLAGGSEEVVPRDQVASLEITDQSVMPMGLHNIPDAQFRNLVWFILNPPGDNRPMTSELRQALIGDAPSSAGGEGGSAGAAAPDRSPASIGDGESVALWNPGWKVACPPFETAPRVLTDFHGKVHVLETHPISRAKPSGLERRFHVNEGAVTRLRFAAAAHDEGDWELRVLVNGEAVQESIVSREGESRWQEFTIDLTEFAGREIDVRLENAANDWLWEFGYWADVRIETEPREDRAAAGR